VAPLFDVHLLGEQAGAAFKRVFLLLVYLALEFGLRGIGDAMRAVLAAPPWRETSEPVGARPDLTAVAVQTLFAASWAALEDARQIA